MNANVINRKHLIDQTMNKKKTRKEEEEKKRNTYLNGNVYGHASKVSELNWGEETGKTGRMVTLI